jgi:hypothetical protein
MEAEYQQINNKSYHTSIEKTRIPPTVRSLVAMDFLYKTLGNLPPLLKKRFLQMKLEELNSMTLASTFLGGFTRLIIGILNLRLTCLLQLQVLWS